MSYNSYRASFQSSEQCAKSLYDAWSLANRRYYEEQSKALELLSVLESLVNVINTDKDGSFFICKEAEDTIERARSLV